MAKKIKKYTKKLRGRESIQVDTQIQLWRKKLKKLGLTTGRHVDKDRAASRKMAAKYKEEEAIVEGKISFFGVDDND